jgi:hypothetical protein
MNLPSTRTISAVLPPSSETGSTCATRVVTFFSSSTTPLNAVPPDQRPPENSIRQKLKRRNVKEKKNEETRKQVSVRHLF